MQKQQEERFDMLEQETKNTPVIVYGISEGKGKIAKNLLMET